MKTVLGLSITTTSVGWVLIDGSDADANILDHDAFDVRGDGGSAPQYAAAVRGAQAIAAASGHRVHSVGVTWSDHVELEAARLLESLADSEFDNILGVGLTQAAQAWERGVARDLGYKSSAVCVIEPAAVTVLAARAGDDAVHTAATHARDGAEGLSQWLTAVFDRNGEQPDVLFLVASRNDLDEVADPLAAALPMTVLSSADDQLALARGAALTLADDEDRSTDKPAPSRSWLASHTRAASMVVAASAGMVIALCAADSQPVAKTEFRAADNLPAADTSVTSTAVPPPPAPPPPEPGLEPLAAPLPAAPPAGPPPAPAVPPPPPQVVDDPSAYPAAVAPVEAAPEPLAPPAAPASPEPLAPPVEASHLAPGAPPAAEPVPIPPPPPPPPPSQDPLGVVLSPLFGALP